MNAVSTWLRDRTGWTASDASSASPAWGRTLGPVCLALTIALGLTGVLLASSYAPTAEDAWASTHHIETTPGGALLRGIHYWATHAILVLYVTYLGRMFLVGGFRGSRDLVWITGVLLLPALVVLAVTGNPLTGTAKAFSQLEVEVNIVAALPVVGPVIRTLVNGGGSVGTLTLIHFYTLHTMAIPAAATALLGVHLWQITRFPEGAATTPAADEKPPALPQGLRDAIAITLAAVAVYAAAARFGAPLEAPPDPNLELLPRPEWYFLFLFELRTYFPPELEYVATQVIPGAAIGLLLIWPWLDRKPGAVASTLRVGLTGVAAVAVAALTWIPVSRDLDDPHVAELTETNHAVAERAFFLASELGVPPTGGTTLLEEDPLTAGPRLFEAHCAGCHPHVDENGEGIAATEISAPNLYRVGDRAWIRKWLDCAVIQSPELMGNTETFGTEDDEMVDFTCNTLRDYDEEELPAIEVMIEELVAALSAEAELGYQAEADALAATQPADSDADYTVLEAGREHIVGFDIGCSDCHAFGDEDGGGDGYPSFVGYMNRDYLIDMIANIEHERFYGSTNERMPIYAAGPEGDPNNILTRKEIALIADWLREDWLRPTEEVVESVPTKEEVAANSLP